MADYGLFELRQVLPMEEDEHAFYQSEQLLFNAPVNGSATKLLRRPRGRRTFESVYEEIPLVGATLSHYL